MPTTLPDPGRCLTYLQPTQPSVEAAVHPHFTNWKTQAKPPLHGGPKSPEGPTLELGFSLGLVSLPSPAARRFAGDLVENADSGTFYHSTLGINQGLCHFDSLPEFFQ